jgi:hypothetical protein
MTYQLKEHMQETVNVLHSNPMHRIKSYSEEWMPFDHSPPRWDDYDTRNKQVSIKHLDIEYAPEVRER